jgi:hypothetical protein
LASVWCRGRQFERDGAEKTNGKSESFIQISSVALFGLVPLLRPVSAHVERDTAAVSDGRPLLRPSPRRDEMFIFNIVKANSSFGAMIGPERGREGTAVLESGLESAFSCNIARQGQ